MADRDDDDDDDDASRPPPAKASRRPAWIVVGLLPLGLCCLCGAGLLLGRGALARYVARAALSEHGISCGDGFDVTPDATFAHAEIAPCTCTMEQGAVESFEIVDPLTVDLDGQRVTAVRAGTMRVAMRGSGPPVDAGSLGPLASMLGVPARIGGLVSAASEVARMSPPPIEVATLEVTQGGRPAVSVDALALDGASPLGITAHEVTLPSLTGPLGAHATVTIDGLTGTASGAEVRFEGRLALTGAAPIVGTVTRGGTVTVTGTGLDGDSPAYRIEL